MDYRTCSDEELIRMQKNIEKNIEHFQTLIQPLDNEQAKHTMRNEQQKLYSIEREFKRRYP